MKFEPLYDFSSKKTMKMENSLGDTWTITQELRSKTNLGKEYLLGPGSDIYTHERDINYLSDESGHGKDEIPEEIRKFLNSNHLYEDLTINGERNKSSSLAGFMSETAKRIVDCCINNNKRESYKILEIGGGIGLLSIFISSMLKKRGIENIEYTHIDLPETSLLQKKLIRSYWSNVKTTTSGSSITNITKKITFKIIDTNTELPENKYDCIINIMSMCEMDDINALKYVDYINLSCNIGAIVFFKLLWYGH